MIVADQSEFRALPASIAAARAYRALALGDIPATKTYARTALALVPEDETIHRTQATAMLGMAEYAGGDLAAAEQEFLQFQALMWKAGDIANALSITFILANIKQIQGRLCEAVSAYRQSLRQAEVHGQAFFIGISDLNRGLSELLCEQGDLDGASRHLEIARRLGEKGAQTGWDHRLRVAQAMIKQAQGDFNGALRLLEEAERQYVRNPLPERPIGALKARIYLRLGRLTEAEAWAREQNLSAGDDLSYLREFEHLTLARVLIARFLTGPSGASLSSALELLDRLLRAAEAGGRNGSAIEIWILQALAAQAQGDTPHALASLGRALTLAGPQGYTQIFLDKGDAMHSLLQTLANQRGLPQRDTVERLLAAFPPPLAAPDAAILPRPSSLVEPLSERELQVLRLLRSELSGPEIAEKLVVSLNTLRTHTKNIFSKLGVNNRRAAVLRAEELKLI